MRIMKVYGIIIDLYSITEKDALFIVHFQNHKNLKYIKVAKQKERTLNYSDQFHITFPA